MNANRVLRHSHSLRNNDECLSYYPSEPNKLLCLDDPSEIIRVVHSLSKMKKDGIITEKSFKSVIAYLLSQYVENVVMTKLGRAFKDTILEEALN